MQDAPGILIVDDIPSNLQVLSSMLSGLGYMPRPVPSGRLALQAAAAEPPDLVLMDVMMPDMDGYETCRRLKAAHPDLPVIFVSALTEPFDKVLAFQTGAVDYLTKPVSELELQARMESQLHIRRLQSDLRQRNQELAASLDRLTELESLRDSLTHMVAHDMRSPLTSVLGFLDLIQMTDGERLSAKGAEFIGEARRSGERLVEMIGDILDVSRLESSSLSLQLSPVDLRAVADQVVAELMPVAAERRVSVDVRGNGVECRCDAALVRRVLQNLLGNALKFATTGGRVEIGVESVGDGVSVWVEDDGMGVPADFRERVFEKFGQVEVRGAGVRRSSGLGLTFCKLAVEAHGGRIGLEGGSRFWFELPSGIAT